jgi:hypothetical protein
MEFARKTMREAYKKGLLLSADARDISINKNDRKAGKIMMRF